jgi:UDP-N-acetylglucosamine--N-acetylmuramyl-(pentapeptide) pyrophosphoryl-undecaprenol N-acetylglucosamine transferase
MGGYASGPAGLASALWRRPLVIHEQNAVMGTTNRWLAPFARRVLAGLPSAATEAGRAEWVGNPVRPDIAALYFEERLETVTFSVERPLQLLVLGGSLGAMPLNTLVPLAVAALQPQGEQRRITVRHQCGAAHQTITEEAWQAAPAVAVDVQPFIDDMAAAYQWADLVVCRAGALTVSELAAAGCPAVLVPLPHAIDDHQTANAKTLVSAGAALLLPQTALQAGELTEQLQQLLAQPARLQRMAQRARAAAQLRATERVADILEEVADVR